MGSALVLAGGGVAGIAWELGVLRGIADADPALADRILSADLVIGTSAGSSVAAQITSGRTLDELYQAQLAPESAELEIDFDVQSLVEAMGAVMEGVTDHAEARRRIGKLALEAKTVEPELRQAAIDARLPSPDWPARTIVLPAVDAATGEPVFFTAESGVPLRYAVAASCAVPGVWPPVEIDGRRYVDGGVRSMTNTDRAAGSSPVLIVYPALPGSDPWGDLDGEIAALGAVQADVIYADEASIAAFGVNPLSPATRGPAARAGRAVGAARAASIAESHCW